jgi:hypothetical protein
LAPHERLSRRKQYIPGAALALVIGAGWSYFRGPERWVWVLFALVPYGVAALLQVISQRESFWLDRIGMLGGGLIAYFGWRLTSDAWLLGLAIGAALVALIDFSMRRAHME